MVAHFVVLSALVQSSMEWHGELARSAVFLVGPLPEGGTAPAQALVLPGSAPARQRRSRAAGVPMALAPASAAPDTAPAAVQVRVGAGGRDTSAAAGRGSRSGRDLVGRGLAALTPQYGSGLLWVRPLIDLTFTSRPIRLDSAVAIRMRAMADSVDKHPPADPNANPYVSRPWTFRAGGKTYGLDSKGLHLGDFTIPTALLAFLSMPQGNIDQARANRALMEMRGDILRAAARAQAEDDFRRAVRELRARKDKERQDAQSGDHPQPAQP